MCWEDVGGPLSPWALKLISRSPEAFQDGLVGLNGPSVYLLLVLLWNYKSNSSY